MAQAKISRINPEYNPDWKNILEDRISARDRLEYDLEYVETTTRLSSNLTNTAMRYEDAKEAVLQAYRMQHRTIGEYADWLFKTFPVPILPDTEIYTTMDEVDESWSDAKMREIQEPGKLSAPAQHMIDPSP